MYKDVNSRTVRITLIDGTQINGLVNIDREPGYDRLSDIINSNREPFFVLTNATMHKTDFEGSVKHPIIFINKQHILWATPEQTER